MLYYVVNYSTYFSSYLSWYCGYRCCCCCTLVINFTLTFIFVVVVVVVVVAVVITIIIIIIITITKIIYTQRTSNQTVNCNWGVSLIPQFRTISHIFLHYAQNPQFTVTMKNRLGYREFFSRFPQGQPTGHRFNSQLDTFNINFRSHEPSGETRSSRVTPSPCNTN